MDHEAFTEVNAMASLDTLTDWLEIADAQGWQSHLREEAGMTVNCREHTHLMKISSDEFRLVGSLAGAAHLLYENAGALK